MKFLIIGLGSMGKRRIRCLKALGIKEIYGFDKREDRVVEVKEKYSIAAFTSFDKAVQNVKPDALIISVPPNIQIEYIRFAILNKIHYFIEASVLDDGMTETIEMMRNIPIIAAPSATMWFHPAVKLIFEILKDNELGKISNILLHSGQYLPDWHSYENVSEYYVSNPLTGGAREIVPFELTWFTLVFGFPRRVAGNYRKTIEIEGAEYIDDTYNCLLDYGNFLSSVTVDVVSRYATRRLIINGSKKQLYWSWDENCIKVFDPEKNDWDERKYEMKAAQTGYNANIGENMYIEEISDFIEAIENKKPFINTLEKDYEVLQLLYKIERSDKLSSFIEV